MSKRADSSGSAYDAGDGARTGAPPRGQSLPVQLTSFIGREREIAEVKRLLASTRLLTLTGPGGAGKTRLALQVASELEDRYPHGAWFVDLSPRSESALVVPAIASVFQLRELKDEPLGTLLTNYLLAKHALIILDNCEHLIQACVQIADTLLHACPQLTILATSRQVLGIGGETAFRVAPLALPDAQNAPLETLARFEAIRLFVERARAADHALQFSGVNAPVIARICQRLDGMPLAIELAAARVRSLSVEQIARRLDDRFRLLTQGSRTAPTRQQTLRAAIDWSYGLLSESEQALWRRLSVFAGGWTLEAAEAVCSDDGVRPGDASLAPAEVMDLLAALVDKSVVNPPREVGRYHLLETVRQYGYDKLVESGEAQTVYGRHLEWLVQFAREADPKLRGREMLVWARRLDDELDNIRTALEWALEHGHGSGAAELVGSLAWYYFLRSNQREAKRWAEQAERLTRDAAPEVHAEALFALGVAVWGVGEPQEAEPVLQQALLHYRASNNSKRVGFVLNMLGNLANAMDKNAQADQYYQEALELRKAIGDAWGITHTLQNLGYMAESRGDYAQARAIFEQGLELSEDLGDERMVARRLSDLGGIAYRANDFSQAHDLLARSISALSHMEEKFSLFDALRQLAQVMLAEGQARNAALVLGAIQSGPEELGWHVLAEEQRAIDESIASIRDKLGEDGLDDALNKGHAMTLDRIVEFALAEPAALPPAGPFAPRDPNALTPREVEVLRLVADGLSDAQVAEKLVISVRTVNSHLSSIYGKLGVKSRSAATRYALDHKLV